MSTPQLKRPSVPVQDDGTGTEAAPTWHRLGGSFLLRREASVLVVAIGLMVYFRFASDVFLDRPNLVNIAQASAPGAIVAVGIVLLLVSGEIDLSVGMVFAMAPFLMHYAADFWGIPPIPSILLAIALCALVGLFNGLVVCLLKVPSFVTTLGTFYVLQGIVLTTSNAYPAEIPPSMEGRIRSWLGAADWATLIWCLAIVAFFHVVLTRTRWGIYTVSVGGNPLGATEAGIRVNRIKIGNFMVTSVLGALAGIMEAFRVHTIDPNLGGGTGVTFTALIVGAGFVVSTMSKNLEPAGPTMLPLSTTTHLTVVS